MVEAYLGEIRMFGFGFAPSGWQLCNGQTLAISQQNALFALLGTTYGGNGTTNFMLPNLQSRVPLHQGHGAGLGAYVLGQNAGTENASIGITNLPSHTHAATFTPTGGNLSVQVQALQQARGATAQSAPAANAMLTNALDLNNTASPAIYAPSGTAGTAVNLGGVTTTGGSSGTVTNGLTGNNIPLPILQPYLTISFGICLSGVFPSRN